MRVFIKHCADWKPGTFSSRDLASNGLGWSREQKTAVCFDQKSTSAEPDSKPVRLTAHPEKHYQAMLSSKGQGKELGVAWRSVVLAMEVGASAGRAELHEAGGCVRKK